MKTQPNTLVSMHSYISSQQKFLCVLSGYAYIWQAEALIYGAFKSGRNPATGSGGDNAPLLMILATTTTPAESDSQRNIKSLAHKCWILALPGGRLGPDKRAGRGKRVEQKWRHLAD